MTQETSTMYTFHWAWGFLSHRGTPSHHPNFSRIFFYKPSIWGTPFMETPISPMIISTMDTKLLGAFTMIQAPKFGIFCRDLTEAPLQSLMHPAFLSLCVNLLEGPGSVGRLRKDTRDIIRM